VHVLVVIEVSEKLAPFIFRDLPIPKQEEELGYTSSLWVNNSQTFFGPVASTSGSTNASIPGE
jgi:hypothetical protein